MWPDLPLSEDHASYLAASAITPEVAASIGVRTAASPDQLPAELAYLADKPDVFPALVFPWTEPDGTRRYQIKPNVPLKNAEGNYAKYLFPKGAHAQLVTVRPVTDQTTAVMIVEGSKQCMAAASYAPPGVAVYGVLGCWGWSKEGVPTPGLAVCEDRDVYVCLDGDVTSNLDVYTAAVSLAEACDVQGAASVKFIRLAAGKKAGLDDVLGGNAPDRRAGMLVRMLEKAARKPADTKPKPKKKSVQGPAWAGGDRPVVAVNGDRLTVINELTGALVSRWDGSVLFNYGGTITRVLDGASLQPLEDGAFLDTIAQTAITVTRSEDGEGNVKEVPAWPDQNTLRAVASRATSFTTLDHVQRCPFIRQDGTVCAKPGYDPASRTLLELTDLEEVSVPDSPTDTEVTAAVAYLQREWLGDFPFPTPADRANALALVLTPIIRGLTDVVPVAVVNGLQMGVGKNKFANCVSLVATGKMAVPLGYNQDNEEQRKVMTSVFRTGQTLLVWDECHKLTGEHFARAVTSHTYSDRILGGSVMAEFPNVATWITLGNGVQVQNDMARRAYEIAMRTTRPNPQDRKSTEFRHPDIEGWTAEHRPQILAALLTLVRAWVVAGRPGPEGGTSFGSFEKWEKVIGGIFRVAGVDGFLGNMREFRSDSDFDRAMWQLHMEGLADFFGGREFTTKEVQKWLANNETAEAPPGFTDPAQPGFSRNLGMAYLRQRDRWYGQHRLMRADGTGHGKVAKWKIMSGHEVEGVEGPGGAGSMRIEETSSDGYCDVITTVTSEEEVFSHVYRGADTQQSPQSLPLPCELDNLLATGAYVPPEDALRCWGCGGVKELVPPSGIGYACRTCYPAMFTRES